MRYIYTRFTQLTPKFLIIGQFYLILCFWMGCSLNSVEQFANSLIKKSGDVNIVPDVLELQIGKAFVSQHEQEVTLYTDPVVTSYINDLGQLLVQHSKRSNITYTFKVVSTKGINAYAVPGGFIYVHLDLIRAAKTESELAAVLGHEIGHIVGRHSVKRLTKIYGIEYLKRMILDEDSSENQKLIADILAQVLLLRYNRDQERESDFYGVQNVYDAGINPEGAAKFFETLRAKRGRNPSFFEKFLLTHPVPAERVVNVRNQIAKLPPKSGLRTNSPRFQRVKRRIGH